MQSESAQPTLDDLLAHEPFVRALALALVRDEGRADDLTQDLWLTALRSPPTRTGNLRGWLATVLRNLVRMGIRGETRRRARERGGRAGNAPPAGEVAARIEIRRRLVDLVEALDEPYRTAVVLRYFDGLRPVDIARRLGVPAKTVQTRLRRALERLRVNLDETRERGRWRLLLVPGADGFGTPMVSSASGSTTSISTAPVSAVTLTGVAIMSTKAKAVLVLVLVAATAGFGIWQLTGDEEGADAGPLMPAGAEPDLRGDADTPTVEAPSALETAPVRTTSEPPADGRLLVRVIAPDGAPAEGVRIHFRAEDEDIPSAQAMTDSEGRAALAIDRPGRIALLGFTSAVPKVVTGVGPPPPNGAELLVRLEAGLEIRGVLFDRHGSPLANAAIRAELEDPPPWFGRRRTYFGTKTGGDGSFTMSGLLPGRYSLRTLAMPSAGEDPKTRAEAGDRNVKIVLGPLTLPVILARDAETGRRIRRKVSFSLLTGTGSDAKEQNLGSLIGVSEWRLGMPPAPGARIRATAEGYLPADPVPFPASKDGDLLVVVCLTEDPAWRASLVRLELVVRDDAGEPVPRAVVSWEGSDNTEIEGGRGEVELPPGPRELTVRPWGKGARSSYVEAKLSVDLVAGARSRREVVLTRSGLVTFAAPAAGSSLRILDPAGAPHGGWGAVAIDLGEYRVSLPPGRYLIELTNSDGARDSREVEVRAGETRELRFFTSVK